MSSETGRSSVATLPNELYEAIASHIEDRRDILSLSVTSRIWSYEAEKRLYHSLSLSRISSKEQCEALLAPLTSCPRVAHYVLSFKCAMRTKDLMEMVRYALGKMKNLKSLDLWGGPTCLCDLVCGGIAGGAAPFQLHDLTVSCLEVNSCCNSFFHSQRELVDINLGDNLKAIPSTVLSKITTLRADGYSAAAMNQFLDGPNNHNLVRLKSVQPHLSAKFSLFPSIRSLSFYTRTIFRDDDDIAFLSSFPNVEFFETDVRVGEFLRCG